MVTIRDKFTTASDSSVAGALKKILPGKKCPVNQMGLRFNDQCMPEICHHPEFD